MHCRCLIQSFFILRLLNLRFLLLCRCRIHFAVIRLLRTRLGLRFRRHHLHRRRGRRRCQRLNTRGRLYLRLAIPPISLIFVKSGLAPLISLTLALILACLSLTLPLPLYL